MGVSVNSAGSTTGAVAMAGTFGYELNLGKLSEEEKEEITAEKIIEQELLKANLQPVTPIVPPAEKETIKPVQLEQVSQPVSKKTAPVKEKSPVPYLIAVIVVVLLLCGGVILFIYYPDLFSS